MKRYVFFKVARRSAFLLSSPAPFSRTEQGVQEALNGLKTNRTTIVIAHRLSTVRNAEQILVLHEGQVRAAILLADESIAASPLDGAVVEAFCLCRHGSFLLLLLLVLVVWCPPGFFFIVFAVVS